MEQRIPERDWKILRDLHPVLLDRYCERVLEEIRSRSAAPGKSAHQRYLEVFRLIKERDATLATCLDNPRRSQALVQLSAIKMQGLLTEDEFARFSPPTREIILAISSL